MPTPPRQRRILHAFRSAQRTNSEPAKRCVHDTRDPKLLNFWHPSNPTSWSRLGWLSRTSDLESTETRRERGACNHDHVNLHGPAMSLLPADDVLAFAQSKSGLVSYTVSLTRTLSLSVCVWLSLCLDLVSRDRQFRAVPPYYRLPFYTGLVLSTVVQWLH
ncbi:hypothetical protein J3E69DRAFT_343289 [Trichoderma sp. SZMC 28015]